MTTATGSVLIIIRKPPFGNFDSWEGMRLSLSFYAAGAPVDVLLTQDGVLNWASGMVLESKDSRSVSRFVRDIERFEIPLYLVAEDLEDRGLQAEELMSPYPKLVSRNEAAEMMASHDPIITL